MKKYFLIGCLCVVALTGCGNGQKELVEEVFDNTENVTTEANMEETDNKEENGIGKKINYSVASSSSGASLNVDAEYMDFPVEELKTYTMTKKEITDEYLFELAGKIFDKGEYKIVTPSAILSEDEATSEIQYIRNQFDKMPVEDIVGGMEASPVFFSLETCKPVNCKPEGGEAIVRYDEVVPDSSFVYHMERAELRGKIKGEDYVISYCKADSEDTREGVYQEGKGMIGIYSSIAMPRKEGYKDIEGDPRSSYLGENLSDYDTALKAAEEYVKRLGFDNYELSRQQFAVADKNASGINDFYEDRAMYQREDTASMDNNEFLVANGYSFSFSPTVDGIPISVNDYNIISTEPIDYSEISSSSLFENAAYQPVIEVCVDDSGIYDVSIEVIYDVVEQTAANAKPLDFEKADASLRTAYEKDCNNYYNIRSIKPEYRIVKYENSYAMVPVWVYYSNNFGTYQYVAFAVNAIDGSVYYVNFGIDLAMMIFD